MCVTLKAVNLIVCVTLKAVNSLRLIQNMSNGCDYMQLVFVSTLLLTLDCTRIINNHDCFSPTMECKVTLFKFIVVKQFLFISSI